MIINELSQFLINLEFENIPQESIEKAKLCFLDYLAVYFRGLESENSKIAIKTIYELFGSEFNSLNKGFINGIASHSLDLDDGHRLAQLHPGSVVFSTVLALISDKSLNLDMSGEEFLEAVVGAYEIAIVLGMMVNPNHRNQGFHSTGTIGSMAAGASASKLLKLSKEKTEHCLGLCATQSSGLLEADHAGTMGKSLHVGNAVYNGILSAYLAKNGFTGGESLIDGKEGFLKAMATETYEDFCDEENVIDHLKLSQFLNENLGKFHINEVYLKKYPFCRHIHSAIDSTLALKDSLNGLNVDNSNISSIGIETYKIASEHDNYYPENVQDLKQSLPYAVAISLVCDDLSLDSMDGLVEKGLFDNESGDEEILEIREIVKKIKIYNSEDLNDLSPDKRPSKVIIGFEEDSSHSFKDGSSHSFKDGSSHSLNYLEKTTFYPLGEVENPLAIEDILEKFKLLNHKFNINKLQIIKHMEDYSIYESFKELDLLDY